MTMLRGDFDFCFDDLQFGGPRPLTDVSPRPIEAVEPVKLTWKPRSLLGPSARGLGGVLAIPHEPIPAQLVDRYLQPSREGSNLEHGRVQFYLFDGKGNAAEAPIGVPFSDLLRQADRTVVGIIRLEFFRSAISTGRYQIDSYPITPSLP